MEGHTSPGDGRDEECSGVAAYLTVMTNDAPQREQSLRDVCNGRRWTVRTAAVSQHTQCWLNAAERQHHPCSSGDPGHPADRGGHAYRCARSGLHEQAGCGCPERDRLPCRRRVRRSRVHVR
jgi:hypothetical protein